MKRKCKQIQCVISNRELISSESAHSPSTARRYAKGIVLSQQIGFNEGSYASLKDLKNFYRKLNDDKAPSHSLIVRRALDLLSHQVSSYRTHKDIFKDKEILSILRTSKGKIKEVCMTINNLRPALELWDNGFNVIPVKSKPITPTPENPSEDKGLFKQPLISWKKYQDT